MVVATAGKIEVTHAAGEQPATVIGGQLIIPNAGHSGILIYRRYFDQEYYDFAAYELACPYHWNDG